MTTFVIFGQLKNGDIPPVMVEVGNVTDVNS
jgi:hypothetical protein